VFCRADAVCRSLQVCLTKFSVTDGAHIIPREGTLWYLRNGINRYGTDPGDIDNETSIIPIRPDIHRCFDKRYFVLVPKLFDFASSLPYFVSNILSASNADYWPEYHNGRGPDLDYVAASTFAQTADHNHTTSHQGNQKSPVKPKPWCMEIWSCFKSLLRKNHCSTSKHIAASSGLSIRYGTNADFALLSAISNLSRGHRALGPVSIGHCKPQAQK
jgi:hypothetical protein